MRPNIRYDASIWITTNIRIINQLNMLKAERFQAFLTSTLQKQFAYYHP